MAEHMPAQPSRSPDRVPQLHDLARRLAAASRAGHWEALRHIDRELATLLPQLGPLDSWTPEMQQAIRQLQRVHQDAFMRCAEATEQLSLRLFKMQRDKDGWMAYAQHSE